MSTSTRTTHVLNRRKFLAWSGAGAVALAGGGIGIAEIAARTRTDPLPTGTGVLVVLTLYGGNDGLNTVVPAADSAYQNARPDLAYRPEEVLDLGGGLGLNPGMTGLKKHWDNRRLAIVHGVGYPRPDRSHFRSMGIWHTASPESQSTSGWIGRWLDTAAGVTPDPLLAASLDPVLPPMLVGTRTAAVGLPLTGLTLPGGVAGSAFAGLGAGSAGEHELQAAAAAAVADLHRTVRTIGPVTARDGDAAAGGAAAGSAAARAGGRKARSTLAAQLDAVAGCIELGVPTRVYSVSLGGFDTHAGERATQQQLLTEVDTAVSPFLDRMATSDRGRGATMLVYSEFGRRVAANANEGTDHGTASPVFVAGAAVQGGFVGEQPDLTDLDDGDLVATTDFRDVYATLLAGVLGTDPERVLGAGRSVLPLFAT